MNEIVNGDYRVSEKLDMLEEYKKHIIDEIKKEKENVLKGFKFCPRCNEYYKEKAYETLSCQETRNICTYRDAGYGDDDIYEDVKCNVAYSICPVGHKIEENVY